MLNKYYKQKEMERFTTYRRSSTSFSFSILQAFATTSGTTLTGVLFIGIELLDGVGSEDHFVFLDLGGGLFGDFNEGFFDLGSVLGTGFIVGDVVVILAPGLGFFSSDLSFACSIDFITDQDEGEVFGVLGGALGQEFFLPGVQ